jgi:hypothetical protein
MAVSLENLTAWWERISRPPVSQTFRVRCQCGEWLSGERTPVSQTLDCPSCSRPVFVLPASPFPEPKPPKRAAVAGPIAPRTPWIDRAAFEKRLSLLARAVRRQVTLPRVLVSAVTILFLGTLIWSWLGSRERGFAATLPEGLRTGRAALDQGDLVTACRQLAEADRAARGLARGTAQERTARQLYQEALHWSSLSHAGLAELFDAFEESGARQQDFAAELSRRFGRRALVVDGWVDVPSDTGVLPLLDCANLSDAATGRISLAGLPWLASLPPGPRRVLFLGEPQTISRSADGTERILSFHPETCVLATHAGLLNRQGWPGEGLDELLADQQRILSIESYTVEGLPERRPVAPANKGNARGIAPGDPEGDVLAKLRRPDRVARIGIFNRIDEQWIYHGPTRMYVNLARPTTGEGARVTAVNTASR